MIYYKTPEEKTPVKQKKSSTDSNINLSGVEFDVSIDANYNPSSHNAQAGTAVAQAKQQSLARLTAQLGSVLRYKGSVASYNALTQISTKEIGDVYDTKDTGNNYVWNGSAWDKLSEDLTNLVKEATFNPLKTQIQTHISNQDVNVKHVDSNEYKKITEAHTYTSEELDAIIDDVIQSYIDDGTLLTERTFQENITEAQTRIQTTVTENVKSQMSTSFVTTPKMDTYKTQIAGQKSHLITCNEADVLDVYVDGDGRIAPYMAKRQTRTIYLIGAGAEVEETPPEPDATKEMILKLVLPTAPSGSSTLNVNLGPILGTYSGTDASDITQFAYLDWGDGSAPITLGENMGSNNALLSHNYQYGKTYELKITGDIKWNANTTTSSISVLEEISIPAKKTSPIKAITHRAFYNFTGLKKIPSGLLANCTPTSLESFFEKCTVLTEIPANLFDTCTQVTNFSNCFSQTAVTKIPTGLFANCTAATNFSHCFYITKITTLPADLFDKCTKAKNFNNCFYAVPITSIPDTLLSKCTLATDFDACFAGTKITQIPTALFAHCTKATTFVSCFQTTPITSIPAALFQYCTQATNFFRCFQGTQITSIPSALFQYCTQATNFNNCFYNTKITSIPTNLFKTTTLATSFKECFKNTKITTIPSGLFDSCIQAINFEGCFEYTPITAIPAGLFTNNTKVTNFKLTFNNCNEVKDNLPELWNTYPTVTHDQCFCGCRQADNYQDAIVAGWICPDDVPYPPGEMILVIETTVANQVVNLGYNLGCWENSDKVAKKYPTKGTVTWEEGGEPVAFNGNEGTSETGNNPLVHTYAKVGKHKITIKGVVKWNKFSTSSSNSIRETLKSIEIPEGETSPIYFIDGRAFSYCKNLESIPGNLFENCMEVTNFSDCFYNTKITAIPQELFAKCTQAKDFERCFHGTQITAIPQELFDQCTQATDFTSCFYSTQITAIPQELFAKCTQAKDFSSCFYNTKITAIPQGLFDSCTQATDFSSCFYNTKITAIPQGLFDSCTQANDFSGCFSTTQITAIPRGLFDKCTQATNFSYCFYDTKITEIPVGLFDKCTQATNFSYCFQNTQITAIPQELFKLCTQATNFYKCFQNTQITEIPQNLFANNNAVTNFSSTFYNCSKVEGNLPTLWKSHHDVTNHTNCFYNCTQAVNYEEAKTQGWA